MLVLARKVGEEIVIDNDTIVKIIRIDGKVVRVGIEAPDHKKILRRELFDLEGQDNGDTERVA